MDTPIMCTLTAPELAERRRTLLDRVRNAQVQAHRLTNGYAYEFLIKEQISAELETLVALERQCCQFLRFNITETPNVIRLEVTGPPEAVAIIEDFFGGDRLPNR